jgi:DNA polymerase-3 subunit gamma/tau
MSTLYREYRPKNFEEIVGQNHIKLTLEHEIESGKLAHAYLFCGPRGIGKTTIARIFAKAINCTVRKEGEHEPCNACEACVNIVNGQNLDIIEIDAASHTGVDNVRENIISASRISPNSLKYKVFIIDEVHMLSASAFNAMLKILEEPPENVIFILCTTEVHKIPATIISRCQRFDFKRISIPGVVKKLQYIASKENITVDKSILESIARHSEGHLRDAESLFGQVVSIGGKEITAEEADLVIPRSDLGEAVRLIAALAKKDAGTGIAIVNKLVNDGVDLKRFLADTIEILRKIMLAKINPALAERLSLELGESLEKAVNKLIGEIELVFVIRSMEKFVKARQEIRGSFITQLSIEIAIAELCTIDIVNISNNTLRPMNQIRPNGPVNQSMPPRPVFGQIRSNQAPASPKPENPVASSNTSVQPGVTVTINKELIFAKWNEVLVRIKQHNHSLSFILRVCQPQDINGNRLCLAFKYKFHKDRMNDVNIKILVEKVLHEVYGAPLEIESIIDESLEVSNGNGSMKPFPEQPSQAPTNVAESATTSTEQSSKMIDSLLKTFGGKVVG